jgi:hypothetical protein
MTKALLFTSGAFILLKKQNNDLRIKDESHPKDIFFPILFEYLSRKKVITKLNVVHQ